MRLYLVFIFLVLTPLVHAKKDCSHTKNSFKCVKYLKNYDGDTVTFHIPNTHPIIGRKISVRIDGIDTPELRTSDDCEKNAGRLAKRLIENILKRSKRIDLINIKRGKYFRLLADIIADGRNIKTVLLKQNLARVYNGGTKTTKSWCPTKRETASPQSER